MPAITIRNMSFDLQRRLEARAFSHQRSPGREALVLLERILNSQPNNADYQVPLVEPYKAEKPLTQQWLTSAIRQGRE